MFSPRYLARLSALASLFLLVAVQAASIAVKDPGPKNPMVVPGGIADPSEKIVFVVGKANIVEALDMDTGKTLWSTPDACRPLIATATQLVVMVPVKEKTNAFTIRVLDSADGKIVLESKPVELSDWIAINGAIGKTFTSSPSVDAAKLSIVWQATSSYAGGAAPSREILQAQNKRASGVVTVELKTGEFTQKEDPVKGGDKPDVDAPVDPASVIRPTIQEKTTLGNRTLSIVETPLRQRLATFSRVLKCVDAKTQQELWQHDLAPRIDTQMLRNMIP